MHIEPALILILLLWWQKNRPSEKMVSSGHNLLLVTCYICAMKVCAVVARQKTEGAARQCSAMIQPRRWTNSTP